MENGCNMVLGNNPGDLVDIVTNKLSEELIFDLKLYGSGDTADHIARENHQYSTMKIFLDYIKKL